MSKITPKNLSYDTTLPPFLARLQANNSTTSQDGRAEFHVARPKKARNPDEEAEDEPVYFDEGTGETLSRKEWEEKEKFGDGGERDGFEKALGEEGDAGKKLGGGEKEGKESKEKVAAIGGSKKRKAGKVVGGEEEDEKKGVVDSGKEKTGEKADGKKPEKGKTAKKGKKIKLSFGDDE